MMSLNLLAFFTVVAVALLTSSSATLQCGWSEVVLKSGTCDGTCESPNMACMFTKILQDRCGCPPGSVRDDSRNCIKIFRCPNRETLPTQCQQEAIFNSQIKCDKNGLFMPKQVIDGISKCVNPETGYTIPGKVSEQGGKVDCEVMSRCQVEMAQAMVWIYNHINAMDGPNVQCSSHGNYRRRQCTSFTSNCQCVVPQTGTIIPGLEHVGPRHKCKKGMTKCQQEFIDTDVANMDAKWKKPLPKCSAIDGNYPASECYPSGVCVCKDRASGNTLPGMGANMNCAKLTACQKQHLSGIPQQSPIKDCDDDGRFFTKFCSDDGFCQCIDADTGAVVEGVDKVPVAEASKLKCPTPSCPSNMEYSECGGCDRTCDNKDQMMMCTMQCRLKCVCPRNTVWSSLIRKCVAEDECDSIAPPPFEVVDVPPPLPRSLGIMMPPPDMPEALPEMPPLMPGQ